MERCMNVTSKIRLLPLAIAMTLVGAVACADSPTSPQVSGKRSLRDTTVVQGDSTVCRNGYIVHGGRIVCLPEM
jgi:hypothetical protein